MTNKEIKKGLKTCAKISCDSCPYAKHINTYRCSCSDKLKHDAHNLIKKQEKDIKQLKTECTLLDDELRIARQGTIDVLNKLKEKFKGYEAWYYDGIEESYHDLEEEINEFIKELINNAKDKS